MTLHVPAHHAPLIDQRLLRDVGVAVGLALLLLLVLAVPNMVRVSVAPPDTWTVERQVLTEFRAGEREDWAAGVPTQGSSLIEFRAGERGPLP
jgi:hypothetical protein